MIRFALSAISMILGLIVIATAMIGNYRFGYVLNRMQVSATADTLGAFFIILSIVLATGFSVTTLKLVIMIAFLWVANPVASHFLARTEIISNEKIMEECEVVHNDNI